MCENIVNNKQNLERKGILQRVFLHFIGIQIQETILKRSRVTHDLLFLLYYTVHVCLLICTKAPQGSQCTRPKRVSVCSLQHCPPRETVISSLKALKPAVDLASLWMEVLSGIHSRRGDFIHIDYLPQSVIFLQITLSGDPKILQLPSHQHLPAHHSFSHFVLNKILELFKPPRASSKSSFILGPALSFNLQTNFMLLLLSSWG